MTDSRSLFVNLHWAWSPLSLVLLLPLPALTFALIVPESSFPKWGPPFFLTEELKVLALINLAIVIFIFSIGRNRSQVIRSFTYSKKTVDRIGRATSLIASITFLAYGAWAVSGLTRGLTLSVLFNALAGSNGAIWALKTNILEPISGVTTWTQLGILLGPLALIRWRLSGQNPLPLLVGLIVATLLRAVFFSERLALVEVVIASTITFLMTSPIIPRFLSTPARVGGLWILGIFSYLVFFAVTELVRSWTFYSAVSSVSVFEFAVDRALAYYATAVNNGALFIESNGFGWDPLALLQGNFGFLGVQELLNAAGGSSGERFSNMLWNYSDPEFSNVSSLLITYSALGILGSWVLWTLISIGIVKNNRLISMGSIPALLTYSFLSIGLLEIVRLFYFGQSRTVPVLVTLIALSFYLHANNTIASELDEVESGRQTV